MRQQISFLTQSRFYSPAFNAAIFDGPVRIYFAQYQEQHALKVYFKTQQKMKEVSAQARDSFRRMGVNIFVMLYPNLDTFQMSFADAELATDGVSLAAAVNASTAESLGVESASPVVVARLGRDFVIGATGQYTDGETERICDRIFDIANNLIDVLPPNLTQAPYDEVML